MKSSGRIWNERKYQKYLKEGRGHGILGDYKPWITVQDIPSHGRVSRILGLKTGRVHHLLSKMELAFFLLLDSSPEVTDIREQYPLLDISETMCIAYTTGIRHPADQSSGFPYALTTDFLINCNERTLARSIKPKEDLRGARTREKLELERRYWKARDIDWKIVTEDQIDWQKAANLEWLHNGAWLPEYIEDPVVLAEIVNFFKIYMEETSLPVLEIARSVETAYGMEPGTGIQVFQYMILQRILVINLEEPLRLGKPREPAQEGSNRV